MAPASPWIQIWHVACLACLSQSFRLVNAPGPIPDFMASLYGGKWGFLTIVGLATAWLTFATKVVRGLTGLQGLTRLEIVFATIAIPLEGVISILYWGIVLYDPSLMVPNSDPAFVLPLPIDLSLHFLPALLLWTDFFLFSPPFPSSTPSTLLAIGFGIGYSGWAEWCATKNGFFAYPFLTISPLPVRIGIYTGAVLLSNGLFEVVQRAHLALDRRAANASGQVQSKPN